MEGFFKFLCNGGEWIVWPVLVGLPYLVALWTGRLTTLHELGFATIVALILLSVGLMARRLK